MTLRIRACILMTICIVLVIVLIRGFMPDTSLERAMARLGLGDAIIVYGEVGAEPRTLIVGRPASDRGAYFSLSKPITAATIMALVEQGRIRLDEKFAGATVRQILRHEGGWDRTVAGDPVTAGSPDVRCIDLPFQPHQFVPGTRQAYSNYGYCLLGKLIEERTGRRYDDAVRRLLPTTREMDFGAWLGPAGGWGGTARQYWNFAAAPLSPQVSARPRWLARDRSGRPYYGLGWNVNGEILSHFGTLSGRGYTIVFRQGSKVVVAMFDNAPANPNEAREQLRAPLLSL